jgi:thiamine monophosphate synthase/ADP-ribose pyrophosphatase YjhB (NUDIX family)
MRPKRFCPFCRHILSKKFIEGCQRLYCPQCQSPLYENPTPATAAVYFNENREVLLVKRKVNPNKGDWCLPGGYVEMEEAPEACCLRELKEETNLEGDIKKLVGVYLSESPVYKSVLVIGYWLAEVRGELMAGDDSEAVRFYPIDQLPTIAFRSHRSLIDDVMRLSGNFRLRLAAPVEKFHFGAYVITSSNHVEMAKRACEAGARIIQYRDKGSDKRAILKKAEVIRNITRQTNTRFMVNDHIDIAMLLPDHFIIGFSTHSLEQALQAQADGADYIAIGPVFSTPTKEDYPAVGLDTVEKVIKAVSIPVVAIGGLNLGNVADLKKIGVGNVAMIRAFQQNIEMTVKQLNKQLL